jgi:hypothetical protein
MGRNRKPRNLRHLTPHQTIPFENQVFHVWCRAIDDMHTFPADRDKREFMHLFERHLSPREIRDRWRHPFRKLLDDVELLAAIVLDNHYHLVIRQKRPRGLIRLMAAVQTAYGHYFNSQHGRRAQIFESPYSVRMAENASDVRGLIEYVHTNHEVLGLAYEFSTHLEYIGARESDWVSVANGLALFGSLADYLQAVTERAITSRELKALRRETTPFAPSRKIRRGPASHIPR